MPKQMNLYKQLNWCKVSEGPGKACLVVIPVVTQSIVEEGHGITQLLILW